MLTPAHLDLPLVLHDCIHAAKGKSGGADTLELLGQCIVHEDVAVIGRPGAEPFELGESFTFYDLRRCLARAEMAAPAGPR